MKVFLWLTVLTAMSISPAIADVDKNLPSFWTMPTPDHKVLLLQIEQDGRFKTTCGPLTLETGTMTAKDGTWSIKADAGRIDKGTFSLGENELVFKSFITGTSNWTKYTGDVNQLRKASHEGQVQSTSLSPRGAARAASVLPYLTGQKKQVGPIGVSRPFKPSDPNRSAKHYGFSKDFGKSQVNHGSSGSWQTKFSK